MFLTYLLILLTSLVPALRGWTVDSCSPSLAITGKGFIYSQQSHVLLNRFCPRLFGSSSWTASLHLPAIHHCQGLFLSSPPNMAKPLQPSYSHQVRNFL